MSTKEKSTRKKSSQGTKPKQKLSKEEMQLAIIKKKKCDLIALRIVETLIEPNVNPEWLLHNLKFINKNHMEDISEERAISKLCGYVLCSNPLTKIINQRYIISTKHNKVYDVTKIKNFCSSRCYGAFNYILEQMLTSPLWLRDKEEIPEFRLLPIEEENMRSSLGEVFVFKKDVLKMDKSNSRERKDDDKCDSASESSNLKKENQEDDVEEIECLPKSNIKLNVNEIDTTKNTTVLNSNEMKNLDCNEENNKRTNEQTNNKKKCVRFSDVEVMEHKSEEKNDKQAELTDNDIKQVDNSQETKNENQEQDVYNLDSRNKNLEDSENLNRSNFDKCGTLEKNADKPAIQKLGKEMKKKKIIRKENSKDNNIKIEDNFVVLVKTIEERFQEWVTEETIKLLTGNQSERETILENTMQTERYTALCEKLNRLQILEEKEDKECGDETKESSKLKPLPDFSVLREESKMLELKVSAFYKGKTVIDPENSPDNVGENDEPSTIVPLVDAHTPVAIRRRIFLNKLNKVLPDLLHVLTGNRQTLSCAFIQYKNEKSLTAKALVGTFNLTAKNVVLRSVEWTLVGLLIIKMLSFIHPNINNLLTTDKAKMNLLLMLMSYKLDESYLDKFMTILINKETS